MPPTSRFSAALVVTSCRSSRTASTLTFAPAIRASFHGHCYDCSTSGCGEEQQRMYFMQRSVIVEGARRTRQRATTVVGATETTIRLWVPAETLPVTTMTALGTTSAATEGRVSTCQWLSAVPQESSPIPATRSLDRCQWRC